MEARVSVDLGVRHVSRTASPRFRVSESAVSSDVSPAFEQM